jgi:hypothetical protein
MLVVRYKVGYRIESFKADTTMHEFWRKMERGFWEKILRLDPNMLFFWKAVEKVRVKNALTGKFCMMERLVPRSIKFEDLIDVREV